MWGLVDHVYVGQTGTGGVLFLLWRCVMDVVTNANGPLAATAEAKEVAVP